VEGGIVVRLSLQGSHLDFDSWLRRLLLLDLYWLDFNYFRGS